MNNNKNESLSPPRNIYLSFPESMILNLVIALQNKLWALNVLMPKYIRIL